MLFDIYIAEFKQKESQHYDNNVNVYLWQLDGRELFLHDLLNGPQKEKS